MNFINKLFQRYFVMVLVLLFISCSSYPWVQIEYSNDDRVRALKNEMDINDAINALKIIIKPQIGDLPYLAGTVSYTYRIVQKNVIINEEEIIFDKVRQRMRFAGKTDEGDRYEYNRVESIKRVHVKYSDVMTVKVFEGTQADTSRIYEIFFYNGANNNVLYITYREKNQLEDFKRFLAAISILMPHAKEEYNKDGKRFKIAPSKQYQLNMRYAN